MERLYKTYVQSGYRNFTYRQEGDIKRYMNGQPDKEEAADTVLNASTIQCLVLS